MDKKVYLIPSSLSSNKISCFVLLPYVPDDIINDYLLATLIRLWPLHGILASDTIGISYLPFQKAHISQWIFNFYSRTTTSLMYSRLCTSNDFGLGLKHKTWNASFPLYICMYVLARIISVLTQLLLEASTTLASAAGIFLDYHFFLWRLWWRKYYTTFLLAKDNQSSLCVGKKK